MTTQRARTLIRKAHLWMGLTLGALSVLLGLTGSVLVFYQEIDALLHPAVRVVAAGPSPGWDSPVWDRSLATVRAAWPQKTGPWRFEVTGTTGSIPARYYAPSETAGRMFAPMMVWLTPDGTQVLRRDVWGSYTMTWIYDLHMKLLIEPIGGELVGYSGLAILALLLSGLWAWWPKGSWSKALRYKRSGAYTRKLRDLHKLAGLIGLPMLLMLVATGTLLGLPEERDHLLAKSIGPVDALASVKSASSEGPQIPISRALATAHAALPQARLAWIEVPGAGNGVVRLRMQQPGDPSFRFPHSYVAVDQHDGRLLAVLDADSGDSSTTIVNWLHPLHDASVGGLGFRILTAVFGLLPLFLFATGWMRWLRQRRGRAALSPTSHQHSKKI